MSITSRIAMIKVTAVRTGRGNRALAPAHVSDLNTTFGHTTFATTVVLRPVLDDEEFEYEVVAGFHRMESARQSGLTEIPAIIVEDASDVQLELIRLHENLLHRPLTPAQEAKAMARTRDIYQILTPGAKRGGDRRSKAQVGSTSFADKTAAATGRSKTAINRAAARGEQVAPDVLNTIQNTSLDSGAFLDKLAKVSPIDQRQLVADELAQTDSSTSFQSDIDGDLTKLRRAWAKACPEAQAQFLAEISDGNVNKNGNPL